MGGPINVQPDEPEDRHSPVFTDFLLHIIVLICAVVYLFMCIYNKL